MVVSDLLLKAMGIENMNNPEKSLVISLSLLDFFPLVSSSAETNGHKLGEQITVTIVHHLTAPEVMGPTL